MEIPIINLDDLNGESRSKTISLLHEACANWGFFWLEKHGIKEDLMDKIKGLVNQYYEENMKEKFYESDVAQALAENADWESSFFYRHQPDSNINETPQPIRETLKEFVEEQIRLAEQLSELMSENLGLEKDHIKTVFSDPFVSTKVAKYPKCDRPELVTGLRAHTDAGGIILLLQDETVPGLEFMKDGRWLPVPPAENHRIFVNLGDQIEVLSNGIYKSIHHRVITNKSGSRLSIATFYNPGGNSVISPASKLIYPSSYKFKDYLECYMNTKFSDKVARFKTMKDMLP
ncbi:hypothetical protein LUZ60_009582 [Juncus effusus]|nr:hypothetical protein LUZ60_009582 [Juncus effusus]